LPKPVVFTSALVKVDAVGRSLTMRKPGQPENLEPRQKVRDLEWVDGSTLVLTTPDHAERPEREQAGHAQAIERKQRARQETTNTATNSQMALPDKAQPAARCMSDRIVSASNKRPKSAQLQSINNQQLRDPELFVQGTKSTKTRGKPLGVARKNKQHSQAKGKKKAQHKQEDATGPQQQDIHRYFTATQHPKAKDAPAKTHKGT
jgi:hypothetical protein